MNEINGTDLRIWINGNKVADATTHSLSIQMKTRPTSNKDSGKFDTEAAGRFGITAQSDALMVYGNFEAILAAMILQQPVSVAFGNKEADPSNDMDETVFYATGMFLITGFDSNASDADNATYSIKLSHNSGFVIANGAMLLQGLSSPEVAGDDGAAGVLVAGGTPPYTYLWDNDAETTPIIHGLSDGTYEVTVTDSAAPAVVQTLEVIVAAAS